MKKLLALAFAAASSAALAAPGITGVSLEATGDPATTVRINYTLTGEPAVVTMEMQTKSASGDWVSLGGADGSFVGAVNMSVDRVGEPSVAYWLPTLNRGPRLDAGCLRAVVKAWPKDQPPDYMTIDLSKAVTNRVVRFYERTSLLPGGSETNRLYKTDVLLMRKIPAAGVVWMMGTPEGETNRELISSTVDGHNMEVQHKVMLTDDYYMGIYEVTERQYFDMAGGALHGCGYTDNIDSDILPFQQIRLSYVRGQTQDSSTKATTGYWPENGHTVTVNSVIGNLRAICEIDDIDLPTTAQWEYACRGGTSTALPTAPNGKPYGTGNMQEIAWHSVNTRLPYVLKDGTTLSATTARIKNGWPQPVGGKPANNFGLYDMIGNVAEACLDRGSDSDASGKYGAHDYEALVATFTPGWESGAVTTNPTGRVATDTIRGTMRGGAWLDNDRGYRSGAYQVNGNEYTDGTGCGYKGFRLCCSVKAATK